MKRELLCKCVCGCVSRAWCNESEFALSETLKLRGSGSSHRPSLKGIPSTLLGLRPSYIAFEEEKKRKDKKIAQHNGSEGEGRFSSLRAHIELRHIAPRCMGRI